MAGEVCGCTVGVVGVFLCEVVVLGCSARMAVDVRFVYRESCCGMV